MMIDLSFWIRVFFIFIIIEIVSIWIHWFLSGWINEQFKKMLVSCYLSMLTVSCTKQKYNLKHTSNSSKSMKKKADIHGVSFYVIRSDKQQASIEHDNVSCPRFIIRLRIVRNKIYDSPRCIRFVRIRDSPRRVNFVRSYSLVNVFSIGRIEQVDTRLLKGLLSGRIVDARSGSHWSGIGFLRLPRVFGCLCGSLPDKRRGLIKFNLHSRHLNRSIWLDTSERPHVWHQSLRSKRNAATKINPAILENDKIKKLSLLFYR